MCKFCGCQGNGNMQKCILKVDGMSCGHCKNAVEKAVRGLPGVMAAEADVAAKTLTVEFDKSKSVLDDLRQAVEDAGYSVTGM